MAERPPEQTSSSSQVMVPPNDLGFNNFVADISRELRVEDLAEIKLRLDGIINRDVRTWTEAFHFLKIEGYIAEDNFIYLQHIVRLLNRADLLKSTVEYAQKCQQKVLHFYETIRNIPPGNRYVRIHVVGERWQTRDDLNTLQMTISQILSVPPADVSFAGIQATDSLYVTLTLPAVYVETLEKFLEDKTKHHILRPLIKLGIDRINISEKCFELEPGEEAQRSDVESDTIKIINKLQLELQQKAYQIKQLEDEILRQRRIRDEASNTKNQSGEKQSTTKRKPMHALEEPGNKRSSIERTGSFSYDLMKRSKQNQDSHPIKNVIVI